MRIYTQNLQQKLLLLQFMVVCLIGIVTHNLCSAAEPLDVYVVNYPLKYFSERIGGKHIQVTFPAPPDVDPAFWAPDITTITKYQQADLILLNGASYAKWVKRVSLPGSKLVNTSKAFKDRYITVKGLVSHSHGPGGKHAHGKVAFTTWLDFKLAAQQAEAVAEALARKLPRYQREFGRNLAALQSDLGALDAAIRDMSKHSPGKLLVASHPVYDYLARRYALKIKSVHWEPDQFPADRQWLKLQELLITHPAKWIMWEGEPIQTSVDKLKTYGVSSFTFDPCANTPASGNFLTVMRQNIENLRAVYTAH
jgi:zinc transport system substrate-binding protein